MQPGLRTAIEMNKMSVSHKIRIVISILLETEGGSRRTQT